MRAFSTLALAGLAWLALGSTSFADVRISIHDGQVSLSAKDATVRQILTEWARVGRTQIVNVERISGGPITIEFNNVPEQEALDMLLRSVSGYMVMPRSVAVSDASLFDRVVVMPTTAAPRPAPSAAPPPPAPFAQFNGVMPQPQDDDDRPQPGLQLPPAMAPIFQNFPQQQQVGPNGQPRRPVTPNNGQGPFGTIPQQVDPQNGQPLSTPPQTPNSPPPPAQASPASPFGAVSAPGMIAPAPAQPGQVFPQGGQPQGFPPVPQQPQPRRTPNDN